ncbi:polyprenyl synthetase family protein [Candidatus Daviesbacteria bacterium]|nr:polyprenyl synthetase family protein [Candidatus Daviesbacteria bacterium]
MDKFVNYLKQYNQDLDPVIEKIFNNERKKVSKIAPIAGSLVDDYKNFLGGGKKLRGCEILLGYEIFGGKDKKEALLASLVIEIIHSFLLIHDDIMDQDTLRRGKPTMHKIYEKEFGRHYGISMAIDIGDEGIFFAYRLLNSLNFPPESLSSVTYFLSRLLMEVGLGQALDITYEEEGRFSEKNALEVHRYKTAEYTIPGPLSIGAMLAGADDESLKAIKQFGIPVGVAFQIRDDELGMFSSEEQLGKPVDSDLRESKVTVLIVKALEKAKGDDLEFLKHCYGNHNLKKEEVERVKNIIKKVGALQYSHSLGRKLVEKGKKFIPQITGNPRYQKLLTDLADFVLERES